MTREDFPDSGRCFQLASPWNDIGKNADAHTPTEREPSTAIFRFLRISPVIRKGRKAGIKEGGEVEEKERWKDELGKGKTQTRLRLAVDLYRGFFACYCGGYGTSEPIIRRGSQIHGEVKEIQRS